MPRISTPAFSATAIHQRNQAIRLPRSSSRLSTHQAVAGEELNEHSEAITTPRVATLRASTTAVSQSPRNARRRSQICMHASIVASGSSCLRAGRASCGSISWTRKEMTSSKSLGRVAASGLRSIQPTPSALHLSASAKARMRPGSLNWQPSCSLP